MFEQAVITERKRPWTMAVSVTLQSAFIGTAVLLSILNIERLPNVTIPAPLPPLAAPRPFVEIVETVITRSAGPHVAGAAHVFTEPVRVPTGITAIVDPPAGGPPAIPALGGLIGTGLPPGLYTGTPLTSERMVVPPPPYPAQQERIEPKPARTIAIGGNVLEGKLLKRVIPQYPALARQARISGTVRLLGVVGRDGGVRELKVVSGHPLLVPAAVEAVRQWVYSPTILNGEPVEVMAPIDVHFTLEGR